jgi:hypothetical protein
MAGGDGGETRNFEKNFGAPPQKLYAFSRPPLMHLILFKDPPPLVPLENIILY